MLKNNILISLRQMRNNPFVYTLNILGLAIGIAAFLFIGTYVSFELSFDDFHDDAEQLYRVNLIVKQEGQDPYVGAATFPRVGPALLEEFDDVENACRLVNIWTNGIGKVGDNPIEHERMYYADPSFFEMFSYNFIHGDPSSALDDVNAVVLTQSVAQLHFGDRNPVGEFIEFKISGGDKAYKITGVVEDRLATHLEIDIFFSMATYIQEIGQENNMNWSWFDFVTYVKLKKGTDLEAFDKALIPFINKHGGERLGSKKVGFDLIAVENIHLDSHLNQEIAQNGDRQTVMFLFLIGCFIVIIAWINYVNLYTAKATDRNKEVGIRKALGSSKKSLLIQFFIESALLNLISVSLGVMLFAGFKQFSFYALGVSLPSTVELLPELLSLTFFLWFFSTIFSGSYPAFFISNFKTIPALKGSNPVISGGRFRKILVIFQFMASGFMICGTTMVFTQIDYMNNKSLGVNTRNTIVFKTPNYFEDSDGYIQALKNLNHELKQFNGVEEVSYSSDVPGVQVGWRGSSFVLGRNERKLVYKMTVGMNYLSFLEIEFLAGRNFRSESDSMSVILNEEAIHFYGFESPESAINQRIRFTGIDTLKVVGVIANYHQESIKEAYRPTAYLKINEELGYLFARVNPENHSTFLEFARQQYESAFPGIPFTYQTMDDLLRIRHTKEKQFNILFSIFSVLAIFIAFIGLLGLAYYIANKKRKEVGIRKVLGSSVISIIKLVFMDLGKLVLIGNLLAIPAFWKVGSDWLNQFTFNVGFSWAIPLLAILITLLLSFVFTFFHLLRLARTNPVDVIKAE